MRFSSRSVTAALVTALAGVGAAGCGGSSAPTAPPTASVSVTVPVNGAVLSVPRVTFVGTVAAGVRRIRVAGDQVPVHRGAFSVSLRLHPGRNRIRILAAAPGLVATKSSVMVRYLPGGAGGGPSLADRVNGVCATLENRSFLLGVSTQVTAQTYHRLASLVDREVTQFRSITPPPSERAAYGRFLALEATVSGLFHHLLGSTSAATTRAVATSLVAVGRRRDTLGLKLGFTQCVALAGELQKINGY